MPITFDPAKSNRNAEARGMPFEMAADFDFETAMIRRDVRRPYPESHFQGIGKIGNRTVMLVFTPTADGFRVISLRPRQPQGAHAMARKPPMIDDDASELTDAELAEMRPAREVLSAEEFAAVSSVRRGRPPTVSPKVPVTIRLDPAAVSAFKATGPGWQTRMNDVLVSAARRLPKGETTR